MSSYRVMVIKSRPKYHYIRHPRVKVFRSRESFVIWMERKVKSNRRLDFVLDYRGCSPNFWRDGKLFVDVVLRIRTSDMTRDVQYEAIQMIDNLYWSMH